MMHAHIRWRLLPGLCCLALLSVATITTAADDTAKIQALLSRGGAVKIPAGVHTVGPLSVPAHVTSITGAANERGSTLRLKENSGPSARVLTVKRASDTDSTISISNLSIDMNRDGQGWQGKHDLEHQGAIFLESDKAKRGVLKARIQKLTVKNSAGDGIYVYHRAQLDLADYDATDVYRAALGITGKKCAVVAKDCRMIRAGIDVEPNSDGDTVDVKLDSIECSKFDVALTKHSKFSASNVTATDTLYLYCHPEAEFACSDSTFTGRYKVRLVGRATFERCKFTGPKGNNSPVIALQWAHKSLKSEQRFTLVDCVINGPGSMGIDTGVDSPTNGNVLVLNDVTINGTTGGVAAQKGKKGVWEIERSTHNGKPIR